jgi:hypothetical protein
MPAQKLNHNPKKPDSHRLDKRTAMLLQLPVASAGHPNDQLTINQTAA